MQLNINSEQSSYSMYPGETFTVEEIEVGDDGELFLMLADARGCLFDKHPELGTMCFRVY